MNQSVIDSSGCLVPNVMPDSTTFPDPNGSYFITGGLGGNINQFLNFIILLTFSRNRFCNLQVASSTRSSPCHSHWKI